MKKENTTLKGTEETRKFLQENMSKEPYDLMRFAIVEWYPKIEIDFNKVPDSLFEKAEKDLALFKMVEKKRSERKDMEVGDFIKHEDGNYTKVAIFTGDGDFQDTEGGSFNVGKNGFASMSGGFTGNVYNQNDFDLANELQTLHCWIFSEFWAGGNRGVWSEIKTKVWKKKS